MPEDPLEGYSTVPDAPFAADAERAVIGAMCLDATAINDAIEVLVAEDFYLDSHQRIFRCISELAETGQVDELLVAAELKRKRELDTIGGPAYLSDLSAGIPRGFNVQAYCRIIKEKSILRSLLAVAEGLRARASDQSESAAEILEDVEERVLELSQAGGGQAFSTILDAVKAAGGVDSLVDKMYDPAQMTGLGMGFVDVDKVLGGMQRKELTIVAARPSQGKSAYVLCVAANVVLADPGAVVAFFSVEMSKEALYKRLLAVMAGVNSRKAQEGWLSREERMRLQSAVIRVADRHLWIDDTSMITVTQVRAKARRLKQQGGRLDLIIIDYLQIVQGAKRYNSREQEVASVSRGLKALSKELDVPVLAVAMVGRGSERHGDKRPMLSDLRESGQIEGDADCILFIHRESYYHPADDEDCERGVAEILIAKNREGATGVRKLAYEEEFTRFSNLAVER